jgi:hypothetical protein
MMNLHIASLFKRKREMEIKHQIFDYFKYEKEDGDLTAVGDFKDKDFSHWLQIIHNTIQRALSTKTIDMKTIDNYINITLMLGGQRIDVALIKDGCKSPVELLGEYKLINEGIETNEKNS